MNAHISEGSLYKFVIRPMYKDVVITAKYSGKVVKVIHNYPGSTVSRVIYEDYEFDVFRDELYHLEYVDHGEWMDILNGAKT